MEFRSWQPKDLMCFLKRFTILFWISMNGAVCSGQVADSTGRIVTDSETKAKLLEMIAVQMRSNYERIETWSGAYTFTDWTRADEPNPSLESSGVESREWQPVTEPVTPPDAIGKAQNSKPGYWRVMRGTITFALDNVNGRIHTFVDASEPVILVDVPSGKQMSSLRPGFGVHWIVNLEEMLEFDVRDNKGQISGFTSTPWLPAKGSRVMFRRPSANSRRNTHSFDPRDCFMEGAYSTKSINPLWTQCERFSGWVLKPDYAERIGVVGADGIPVYSHTFKSKRGLKTAWRYDGRIAFNAVDISQFDRDQLSWQRTATFQIASDVFVPATVREIFTRVDEDGTIRPSFIRSITVKKTVLNEPIPDEEFSIRQFEFGYGDRMVDEIKGSLSVYDGAEFVPAEEFVVDEAKLNPATVTSQESKAGTEAPKPPIPRGSRWLLTINGLVLLSIMAVYVYRRRQRNGPH